MRALSSPARFAVLALGIVSSLGLPACGKKDDALRKELVGVWEANPRKGRAKEQIDETAFVTPDLEVIELGKTVVESNGAERGLYTHLVHRPESEIVPSTGKKRSERWEQLKGHWWLLDGEVHLVGVEPNREEITLKHEDGTLIARHYFGPKEGSDLTFTRGKALPALPVNTP
jgi:hypothetical protein